MGLNDFSFTLFPFTSPIEKLMAGTENPDPYLAISIGILGDCSHAAGGIISFDINITTPGPRWAQGLRKKRVPYFSGIST
jgi:hypothetical protein